MSQEQARRFREVMQLLERADWQRDSHAAAHGNRRSEAANESERKAGEILNEIVLEAFKSRDIVTLLGALENGDA